MNIINLKELEINTQDYGFHSEKVICIADSDLSAMHVFYINGDKSKRASHFKESHLGDPCWHHELTGEICSAEESRMLEIKHLATKLIKNVRGLMNGGV